MTQPNESVEDGTEGGYIVTDKDMTDRLDAETELPDEDLTDDEYYGRYGYSRTAPTCDDPECFMCD